MDIYQKHSDLFKTGSIFQQILFLDNFYTSEEASQLSASELSDLLFLGAENSSNLYVRRSCFKIICDLTLTGILANRFKTSGLLLDFLNSDQLELPVIGLKYLPYFPEVFTAQIEEYIKGLSDSSNADIASQCLISLGLFTILKNIDGDDVKVLIENLQQAQRYFQAASDSVENRDDAAFYQLLLEWIMAGIADNAADSDEKLSALEKSLLLRNLYEREGLELDFLIFKMFRNIKSSYDILRLTEEWLDFGTNVRALLDLNAEIGLYRSFKGNAKGLMKSIDDNFFSRVEEHIYKVHLQAEKKRLNKLKSEAKEDLIQFIDKITGFFPDAEQPNPENYELLISLQQKFGEDGIAAYQKIINKNMPWEKAIADLLKNDSSNKMPFKTGSIYGEQVYLTLSLEIDSLLPNYDQERKTAFLKVLEEVIRYARLSFVDNDKSRFSFLYSKSETNGKGQDASEEDLQVNMIAFFEHSQIADGLGHERAKFVDGGRVDILYKKDIITIPIELKKSLFRPDQAAVEQNYIAQAQTYTSGYDQLGIFVLLELSDKAKEPPPNFKDWFKIHHLKPSTNLAVDFPDFVVSAVIPGNRTGPSSKSTYK
jgi:hypothetical protein